MKSLIKIIFIFYFLFTGISLAFAQERAGERMRQEADEQTRALRYTELGKRAVVKERGKFGISYGGWLSNYFDQYNNLDKDNNAEDWIKTDDYIDARLWLRATYSREFMFYARMENLYFWRPSVAEDYTGNGDDYQGPSLDMAYLNIDLIGVKNKYFSGGNELNIEERINNIEASARSQRLLQADIRDQVQDMMLAVLGDKEQAFAESKGKYKGPLLLSTGRQFFTLGRGITYSDVHDGIQLISGVGNSMLLKSFISQSLPHEDNLDYSVPHYDKNNKRRFYGAELSYFKKDTAFYLYGLVQQDLTDGEDPSQDYKYDSQYIGLGISGKAGKDLSYWAEVIKEYGKSYTDHTQTDMEEKNINSWSFDTGVKYDFDTFSKPTLETELAYGSGDPDRSRVTNTIGGNVNGDDTNFNYFGVFNAGYTLLPRLSNIWVGKVGAYFKPFEKMPRIGENIVVGSKYYYYRKDRKSGGIYDIYATDPSANIGQEVDFFVHWKMFKDLYMSARYGLFFPGKAYPADRRETASTVYAKTTLTF